MNTTKLDILLDNNDGPNGHDPIFLQILNWNVMVLINQILPPSLEL